MGLGLCWATHRASYPNGPCRHASVRGVAQGHDSLSRVVQRSLDGLVASLRHRCPALSHDHALRHLQSARADLRAALASARGPGSPPSPTGSDSEDEAAAFRAAAEAAQHPKPAAMAHFLATVERDAVSVVAGNTVLSSANIANLSAMLAPSLLPDDPPQPPLRERRPKIIRIINDRRNNIRRCYKGLLEMADAALRKYAHQTGKQYELHTIYGKTFLKDYEEFDVYIHLNFTASSSSCQALDAPQPICFFAEALRPPRPSYHEDDITLCCIVQPSSTDIDSCHGCLANNHRIDHPEAGMHFVGKRRKMDGSGYEWDWPRTADVDYRFFDPDRDVGLVEHLHEVITRSSALCGRSTYADDNEDIPHYSMRFA